MWNLKRSDTDELTHKAERDSVSENKLMVVGVEGYFGKVMYTLRYLKWITNKDLLKSTGNSARYYVPGWMEGGLGGEWVHVCVWLSPFAVHFKLPQRCSSAIPQYKVFLVLKKRKKISCKKKEKTRCVSQLFPQCQRQKPVESECSNNIG